MTEFEGYKERVSQWLGRRQERVREIVAKKNLSSVMNDTKWFELPAGWFPVDEEDSVHLHAELQRELPAGHILYRKAVTVVADRDGATDDILCRHDDNPARFTVVHLTWSGTTEYDPDCPSVECDGDFDTFLEYEAGFCRKSQ